MKYLIWVILCVLQKHMFEATQDKFGAIDILCNNAGIVDEKNWKKMIAVNMVGCVLLYLSCVSS